MPEYEGPMSITEQDRPQLVALLNSIFRDEGGDMSDDYARHLSMDNVENIRLIKQGGEVVSHVGVSIRPVSLGGVQTSVAGIGAVATASSARGQGFASILMRDAIERSRDAGADLMLISGDNGVYRGLNAVSCGRFPEVLVRASADKSNYGLSVREATHADLDAIIELRQQQSTRYLLPREDIEALWESKWVMDKPSRWWMIEAGGETFGYAITWQDGETVHLLDFAGIHVAALALATTAFEQWSAKQLRWIAQDASVIPKTWREHIEHWVPFEGTVLVLDAKRFLERATPCMIERIGEHDFAALSIEAQAQSVTFAVGESTRSFENGGDLANLFFGGEKAPALGDSPVDMMLKRLFPMPLVWYGMGYV